MAECQRCPFQSVVTALTELVKTFPNRNYKRGSQDPRRFNQAELMEFAVRSSDTGKSRSREKRKQFKATTVALLPAYAQLVEFIEAKVLPLAREICYACSCASDDDNLSRHGRSFVSLDAMSTGSFLASSSRSPSPLPDDAPGGADPLSADNPAQGDADFLSRENDAFFADAGDDDPSSPARSGDWLNSHAVHAEPSQGSSSKLPTHIEDAILSALHDFLQLSVFEQNMLIRYLSGGDFTFVDFAQMGWVPREMHRPQSKEFVYQRWKALCKRFPLAAAMKNGTVAKGRLAPKHVPRRAKSDRVPMVQTEMLLSSFNSRP